MEFLLSNLIEGTFDTNNNNINNNNTNNAINNKNIINEEKTKEIHKKHEKRHTKGRGLRKILNKKAKEKKELLRKYFHKFYQAGILLALRKGTKLANLYKKMEGVDLGTAMNTVARSNAMNEIEVNANSNVEDFQAALNKKKEDKKFAEEIEKLRIEEEKRRKEEEEKINELKAMRERALEIILYKADRINRKILKKKFDIYYLKSKVLSLKEYVIEKPRRVKTIRKKTKAKESLRHSLFLDDDKKIINKMMTII